MDTAVIATTKGSPDALSDSKIKDQIVVDSSLPQFESSLNLKLSPSPSADASIGISISISTGTAFVPVTQFDSSGEDKDDEHKFHTELILARREWAPNKIKFTANA